MQIPPPTSYAQRAGVSLAYQAFGSGPPVVVLPTAPSHLDLMWIDPGYTQVLRRLASFAHTVIFDPRGLGLSDPLEHVPTVEEGADDLEAVMDTARVERAVLLAMGTAYPAAAMFAARAPERVDGVVLVAPWAVGISAVRDTSVIVGYDERMHQAMVGWQDAVDHHWGEGRTIELIARAIATPRVKRNWGMLERAAASPAMIRAVTQAAFEIDLREVLTAVRVPAIVVAREGSYQPRAIPEHVADLIPGAEFDWQPEAQAPDGLEGFMAPFIDAVERMVRGGRTVRPTSRILATVLFTDIVGSTQRANALGDHAWRELLDRHESLLRERVSDAGGRVIKLIGDGSLSIFDGPGRAIRCAADFATDVTPLGLDVRAGLHTGECEILDEDIAGVAVHIAARVSALAAPGEVLVSRTVRDLVVGSGLEFDSRGTHELRGVPDSWELFALTDGQTPAVAVAPELPMTRPSDRVVLAAARRAPSLVRLAGRFART
ncbi:MAG TPA: adenylate/guanylate cyclase domain-containing protein [Solirubrobacteraceae bacterium]|nr:adenylate/guanylate cyclase domain-containing protein [Solirubrobacteraceae bacterium]